MAAARGQVQEAGVGLLPDREIGRAAEEDRLILEEERPGQPGFVGGRLANARVILVAVGSVVGTVGLVHQLGPPPTSLAASADVVGLAEEACVKVGRTCSAGGTCCGPAQCYAKNEFQAFCLEKCFAVDQLGAGWSCLVKEPGTDMQHVQAPEEGLKLTAAPTSTSPPQSPPQASPGSQHAPHSKAECAVDGKDCRGHATCCNAPSNCYVKNDYWASCNMTCDSKRAQDAWDCTVVFKNPPLPATTTTTPRPPSCSWEGEDCTNTKCCRRSGFKCFEQTSGVWASCSDDCSKLTKIAEQDPDSKPWSCKELGGDQGDIRVPPAKPSGAADTTLYCFTVVTPQGIVAPGVKPGYEQKLLELFKSQKVGLYACDDWAVYEGVRVSTGSWQSVVNTDIFNKVWQQVRVEQTYKKRDWTVKVDADAVFFPDRLKAHITNLQPPKDTPIYLRNIDFKFRFQGALEVLSQRAVDVFLENSDACSDHLGHNGGEDLFTKSCLDAIQVGYMDDFKLLDDKYTHPKGWNLFDVDSCLNPAVVALHPYKAVNSWWGCYEVAMKTKETKEFVSCDHRWPGDACSLTSKKVH